MSAWTAFRGGVGVIVLPVGLILFVLTLVTHGEEIVKTPVGKLLLAYVLLSFDIPKVPDDAPPMSGGEGVGLLLGMAFGIAIVVVTWKVVR